MTRSTNNSRSNDGNEGNDHNAVDADVVELAVTEEETRDVQNAPPNKGNSDEEMEIIEEKKDMSQTKTVVDDDDEHVHNNNSVDETNIANDEISAPSIYDNNNTTRSLLTSTRTSEELLQDAINDHLSYLLGNVVDGQVGTRTTTASTSIGTITTGGTTVSQATQRQVNENEDSVNSIVESNINMNITNHDIIAGNTDKAEDGIEVVEEDSNINIVNSKVYRGVVLQKEQRKLRRQRLRTIIKQCKKLNDVVSFTRLLNVDLDDNDNYMNQYFDETYYYELQQYQQQELDDKEQQASTTATSDQNNQSTPSKKRGRPPSSSVSDKVILTSTTQQKPKSSASTTIHRYRISIDQVLGLPSSSLPSSSTKENKNISDNDNDNATIMISNKRHKLIVDQKEDVNGKSVSIVSTKQQRQHQKLITPIIINEYFRHQPVIVSKNTYKSKNNQSQKVISSSLGDTSSSLPAPSLRTSSRRSVTVGSANTDTLVPLSSVSSLMHNDDDNDITTGVFCHGERTIHMIPEDDIYLSNRQLQIWIRQQLEYFSATTDDVELAQNSGRRRTPTVFGRVGIRCIHCKKYATDAIDALLRSRQKHCITTNDVMPTSISAKERLKYWPNGSITYPISVSALYANCSQKVQMHFLEHCPGLPQQLRQQMLYLMRESTSLSMKDQNMDNGNNTRVTAMNYFIISAKQLGLVDVKNGIRFGRDLSLEPISFNTIREQFDDEQQQKQQQQRQIQLQPPPTPLNTAVPSSPRPAQVVSNPSTHTTDTNITTRGSANRTQEPRQQRRPSDNLPNVSADNIPSSTKPQLHSGINDTDSVQDNNELQDVGMVDHSPGYVTGSVPTNDVPAEIESVLAQAVAQEDDRTIIVGRASDKAQLSDYMYLLIKQMKFCHGVSFDYTTRGKKPKAIRIGYAGYNCRWCQQHADTVLNKYLVRSDNEVLLKNSVIDEIIEPKLNTIDGNEDKHQIDESMVDAGDVTLSSPMDVDDELHADTGMSNNVTSVVESSLASTETKNVLAFSDVSCRSFPSACENMSSSICNSFANHLHRCHSAPKALKDAIALYRKIHPYQIGQMVYGSQRKMIMEIWKRIRSMDRTEVEMNNITIIRVYDSEVEFEDGTRASTKMTSKSMMTTRLLPSSSLSSSMENVENEEDEIASPVGRTPNFPHITDPLTLEVLKDSEEIWDPSINDYLIQPSDRYLVTDYVFLAFRQSKIAFPEVSKDDDEEAQDEEIQVQDDSTTVLPGIACMHCLNKEDDTSTKYSNRIWCSKIDSFAPCVNTSLYNHFMACEMVPSKIKHALEKTRKVHSTQCCRIKFGSQRRFFEKIFARLKEASKDGDVGQDKEVVATKRQERIFLNFRDKISKFGFIVTPGTNVSANYTLFCKHCRSVPIALRAQYSIIFGMNLIHHVEEHSKICKKDQVDLSCVASVLDRALWTHHSGDVSVLDYESYHALILTVCGGDDTTSAFKLFTQHIKLSIQNCRQLTPTVDSNSGDLVSSNEIVYGRDVLINTDVKYLHVEQAFLCFASECNVNIDDTDKHVPLRFSDCPAWEEYLLLVCPYLTIEE